MKIKNKARNGNGKCVDNNLVGFKKSSKKRWNKMERNRNDSKMTLIDVLTFYLTFLIAFLSTLPSLQHLYFIGFTNSANTVCKVNYCYLTFGELYVRLFY